MSKEQVDLLSVKVKLFASSREFLGKDEIMVSLPPGQSTVHHLRKKILELYPSLSNKPAFVVAVNRRVADDSTAVSHQDEVAILPPVSGG